MLLLGLKLELERVRTSRFTELVLMYYIRIVFTNSIRGPPPSNFKVPRASSFGIFPFSDSSILLLFPSVVYVHSVSSC